MKLYEIWQQIPHTEQLQKIAASQGRTERMSDDEKQFWRDMAVIDRLDCEILDAHYRSAMREKHAKNARKARAQADRVRALDAVAAGQASSRVKRMALKAADLGD